jgi:hypothetical protein
VTEITFLPGILQRKRNSLPQRRRRPTVSFRAGKVRPSNALPVMVAAVRTSLATPFGMPVLTVSITIIQVGLIVMLMLTGPDKAALPRDTLFLQS